MELLLKLKSLLPVPPFVKIYFRKKNHQNFDMMKCSQCYAASDGRRGPLWPKCITTAMPI